MVRKLLFVCVVAVPFQWLGWKADTRKRAGHPPSPMLNFWVMFLECLLVEQSF